MKTRYWVLAAAAATAVGAAYAADLHTPHIGSGCPAGFVGNYHFVNNQVPDDSYTGTIYAAWDSGNTCQMTAYKVNLHVQHFRCVDMLGSLTGAYTDLDGKLVLSDFSCRRIKKCDPKYDPKCEVQ